jgi:hypothetical protein
MRVARAWVRPLCRSDQSATALPADASPTRRRAGGTTALRRPRMRSGPRATPRRRCCRSPPAAGASASWRTRGHPGRASRSGGWRGTCAVRAVRTAGWASRAPGCFRGAVASARSSSRQQRGCSIGSPWGGMAKTWSPPARPTSCPLGGRGVGSPSHAKETNQLPVAVRRMGAGWGGLRAGAAAAP